jgi:hypothetical protein
MSRKIINTEGPGMVAASARKVGIFAIVAALVVLGIFAVLARSGVGH